MGAAEKIYEVAADLSPDDPLRRAIDVGDGDPLVRIARIEEGLRSGGLPVKLPRQESGFWFGPSEEIRPDAPTWAPPGAVLPCLGKTLGGDAIVMDLVPIDYVWFPLSEAGAYTYAHSAGLLRGETWKFVREPSAGVLWPTVYLVTLTAPLAQREVAIRYGDEAARRAREDYPAVQLQLTRLRT